jgi:hypothetical protein
MRVVVAFETRVPGPDAIASTVRDPYRAVAATTHTVAQRSP